MRKPTFKVNYRPSYVPQRLEKTLRICANCARCTEIEGMHICCQVYSRRDADFDLWKVDPQDEACDSFTEDRKEWVYDIN